MNIHVKKSVPIEFVQVVKAYQKVRQGGKATGIDNESWSDFSEHLEDNLYVIWNRLASGSYHPQAVREVEIPKKDGKMRKLGIPTLRDRIAQQVVKDYMEKRIDQLFHENSYGYRPMKSAHQAIEQVRQNSYKQDWVIDMDISKFFDEIDHELMLKAVRHVISDKWVEMYVKRWLEMPIQKADGTIQAKEGKGTPQGGVISPLLANLYLHCKDYRRKENHEHVKFDFLGFSYQPRARKSQRDGKSFMAFTAEISQNNRNKIRETIREFKDWRNTSTEAKAIASELSAKLRGWINYYGRYSKRGLRNALILIDKKLIKWQMKKYKIGYRKSAEKLKMLRQLNPKMFYHWQMGY